MAAKPKNVSKRTSSVRVTKKKRGISRVQALVIVLVLAAIGVVAVALSSASGTPNYQYSWNKYCVSAYGKTKAEDVQDCKNKSAEAMVYRLYRGIYDKSPDEAGYKYWTQKYAGDRNKITESDLVVTGVAKMGSDTAFVKAVYSNMLNRTATDKEMVAWRTKIKEGKITRAKMLVQFAVSGEAIRKNQYAFNKYAAKYTVSVVQTAAQAQRKRFDEMLTVYQQPSARYAQAAQASLNTAKGQLTAANNTASKNPPSVADLQSIKANQTNAEVAYNTAQDNANKAAAKAAAAKVVYDDAAALANYATDIKDNQVYGITKIGDRYRAAKQNATSAASYASTAKARINDIAGKYTIAKKKYDAEVARQAEIARKKRNCQSSGESVYNSDGSCTLKQSSANFATPRPQHCKAYPNLAPQPVGHSARVKDAHDGGKIKEVDFYVCVSSSGKQDPTEIMNIGSLCPTPFNAYYYRGAAVCYRYKSGLSKP